MSDTVAAGQLRAFVERILRLKEEQDNIAADIRDIYAEAKGTGYDKTTMGQIVAHVRKVGKLGVAAVEEKQTLFDLYLDAYQRGNGTNFATHTHEKPTIDRAARAKVRTSEAMDDNKAFSKELLDAGLISEEAHAENLHISDGVANKIGAGVIDQSTGALDDVPAFLLKERKPLRPLCLNPSECAGYGTHTCHRCLKAAGQSEAA